MCGGTRLATSSFYRPFPVPDSWHPGRIFALLPIGQLGQQKVGFPIRKRGVGSAQFSFFYFFLSLFLCFILFFLKIKWSIREESINLNNFFARVVEGRKSREWVWRSSPITTQEDALYGRYECRTRGLCVCVMWTKISPFPQFLPLLSREKKKSSEFVYIPEMPG